MIRGVFHDHSGNIRKPDLRPFGEHSPPILRPFGEHIQVVEEQVVEEQVVGATSLWTNKPGRNRKSKPQIASAPGQVKTLVCRKEPFGPDTARNPTPRFSRKQPFFGSARSGPGRGTRRSGPLTARTDPGSSKGEGKGSSSRHFHRSVSLLSAPPPGRLFRAFPQG